MSSHVPHNHRKMVDHAHLAVCGPFNNGLLQHLQLIRRGVPKEVLVNANHRGMLEERVVFAHCLLELAVVRNCGRGVFLHF